MTFWGCGSDLSGTSSPEFPRSLLALGSRLDVTNQIHLYESQNLLMVPVQAAFRAGVSEQRTHILLMLSDWLRRSRTLGELRLDHAAGKTRLEPLLEDPLRGGADWRRTFPTQEGGQVIDARLSVLQFSYLISSALKLELASGEAGASVVSADFLKDSLGFLSESVVLSYWSQIEAWHWHRSFSGIQERSAARLDPASTISQAGISYYTVFTDEDWFLFAIASDILSVLEQHAEPIRKLGALPSAAAQQALAQIQQTAWAALIRDIDLRNGFRFQKGQWKDHPTFAHAGCFSETFPSAPCPKEDVSLDIAHFHRMPWWLRSFRDSWSADSVEFLYLDEALRALAREFSSRLVIRFPESRVGPLLTNYADGWNGWFRVGYHPEYPSFGYGPFELTMIAAYGSYYSLAEFEPQIRDINLLFCKALEESSPDRTRIYDERFPTTYTHFLHETDLFEDRFEIYQFICKEAALLGWL